MLVAIPKHGKPRPRRTPLRWHFIILLMVLLSTANGYALEMVLGKKTIAPGIQFIFEGGIKDTITPKALHLAEEHTDVHIEVLANWVEDGAPEGAPRGGFIPYLTVSATIKNERTGKATQVQLLPHVNLPDNFHYARNIVLPGSMTDAYTATFHIHPPGVFDVAFHQRWKHKYVKNNRLFEPVHFVFNKLDFAAIVKATR